MAEDREAQELIINEKKRRLHKLRLTAARFGAAADPSVLMEIEDLEKEVPSLEEALQTPVRTKAESTDRPLSSLKTRNTGDFKIDKQLKRLAEYSPATDHGSAQLLRLIRPLFQRAAFFPEPEGDWLSFAYIVIATRFLIQECLDVVDDKTLRARMRAVVKEIAGLETIVQKVLGRGVTLSKHAEQFVHDKKRFAEELAILVGQRHFSL